MSTERAHFQLYRSGPESPVRWRLLGGNHRSIGRGPLDYPDPSTCTLAIAELVANLGRLDGHVNRVPGNLWAWRLLHEGVELAVSTHQYDRQIRAVNARGQFIDRAATARVDSAVMVTASRRWRSLSSRPFVSSGPSIMKESP